MTVVIGDIGKFKVFLKVGATLVAVTAFWTAEVTPLCLPLQAIEASLAEVVPARKQVRVPVQVQAHRTGELILKDTGLR